MRGNDSANDNKHDADNLFGGYWFRQEPAAQNHHDDEIQGHKRVGVAQIKPGHGSHPGKGGDEGGHKAGEDGRVKEQGKKKAQFSAKSIRHFAE